MFLFYDNCYHATADLAQLLHLRILRPINVINNNNNNNNNNTAAININSFTYSGGETQ